MLLLLLFTSSSFLCCSKHLWLFSSLCLFVSLCFSSKGGATQTKSHLLFQNTVVIRRSSDLPTKNEAHQHCLSTPVSSSPGVVEHCCCLPKLQPTDRPMKENLSSDLICLHESLSLSFIISCISSMSLSYRSPVCPPSSQSRSRHACPLPPRGIVPSVLVCPGPSFFYT